MKWTSFSCAGERGGHAQPHGQPQGQELLVAAGEGDAGDARRHGSEAQDQERLAAIGLKDALFLISFILRSIFFHLLYMSFTCILIHFFK